MDDLGPFSLPHFRKWTKRLILDNGEPWILEPFQESFIADLFEGRRENWLVVPKANAKTTDLNGLIPGDSGWVLTEARAINSKGQITGTGVFGASSAHFY